MLCTHAAPRTANHLTIALKCMLVMDALIYFLDEGKELPYAYKGELGRDFAWALWISRGKPWNRHLDVCHEDGVYLDAVLRRIKKPPVEYGKVFLPSRARQNMRWQRKAAEALLDYFTKLCVEANASFDRACGMW